MKYATQIAPDLDIDEWEQEGYAEMQAELAEIAERERLEYQAEESTKQWERQ